MTPFTIFFLLVFIAASLYWFAVAANPAQIAGAIRGIGPVILLGVGAILTFVGRGAIGLPLVAIGLSLFARARSVGKMRAGVSSGSSTVRSAWIEMVLDHETGDMEGLVLAGHYDGAQLSELGDEQLFELAEIMKDDADSIALLEAYLDRRTPGWRENTQFDGNSGQGSPSGSGPMDQEEAYQILGLSSNATTKEIREAHRRLMKRIHPDSGGSTFLAAKINEAKDVLLGD